MSRFRFRLARILRVREVEEQAARERFLEAQRTAREAEARAQAARDELARSHETLRGELTGTLQPGFVLLAQQALDGLRQRRQRLAERARTLALQSEAERAAWGLRRRDVRGLERLQDRDREGWREEGARREAAATDEVAGVRAAARRGARPSGESVSWPMQEHEKP